MHHCLLTSTQGHKLTSTQSYATQLTSSFIYVYWSFRIVQLALYITQQVCIISYDWQLEPVDLKFGD